MTETNSPDRWTVEVDRANELEASSTLKGIQTDAVLGGMAFLINEIWDHYRNLSERRVRVNVPWEKRPEDYLVAWELAAAPKYQEFAREQGNDPSFIWQMKFAPPTKANAIFMAGKLRWMPLLSPHGDINQYTVQEMEQELVVVAYVPGNPEPDLLYL